MKPSVFAASLALVAGGLALTISTHAQAPDQFAALESTGRVVPQEILVQFRAGASEGDKRDLRGWLNAQRKDLPLGNRAPQLELDSLPAGASLGAAVTLAARHPAVAFVEPNWVYTHQDVPDDPYFTDGSLFGMYGGGTTPFANPYGSQVSKLWSTFGLIGSNSVLVGVIDEGIDFNHPDLAPNIWTNPYDPPDGVDNDGNGFIDDIHGWDFYQNNNTIFDGGPGNSIDRHGTHVSGTIGAASNGTGVVGMNWHVGLISAKFLGPSGGTTAGAVKAVDYITGLKTLHPSLRIVATNNSWGGGGYSQALQDAIIRAANAGILFVAAAGNGVSGVGQNNDTAASYPSNYNTTIGTSTQPAAAYDSVIAVAAICGAAGTYCAEAGSKAAFSNYGPTTVDIGAPGVGVYSTMPNNTYGALSGTSMATPHVTGAAALLASVMLGNDPALLKFYVTATGILTPTPSMTGATVTGGRLNLGVFIPWPAGTSPTGLTVTPVSSSQINLQWTDNSPDELLFSIERCTGSSCLGFTKIDLRGPNVTTYANTGLTPGTTYAYRVRAIRGSSESGYTFSNYTAVAHAATLP